MPLTAKCVECQESFNFPALEKDIQTGRCPECDYQHKIITIDKRLEALKLRIDEIYPTLCKLHTIKKDTEAAFIEAERDWEQLARVHARLDRGLGILKHERDLLTNAKEVQQVKKSGKATTSPEDQALKALKNLSPDVQAAIIQQLKEAQNG